ncbi:hypothetical protein BOTBODRAFT_137720 [Botryobasidium botryosum FD-172 SS1]|uniref:Protein kinase domain-containing protein n=1 Tax=Botryobasidium botryosum (strain FD-172 SS1) TaxID=930990 RepID=A0A067M0Y8_BOTB1|nr:hypothetical protein BOTBODRAFT_137720 [Botryobasidium botryosum FD-172 SS1]
MGEDIEERDSDGRTMLHRAIQAQDFQLAKQLVEQGANVRTRDGHDSEPLHFLARLETDYLDILSPSPFAEIIQVLLDAGAGFNALRASDTPPLYYAYEQDSSLIFRLLVDAGADLSLLDPHIGADMRHFLARVLHPPDDTADMDYLLVGVDVNTHDLTGYTFLDRAVWLGSPSAVKALLRRGADPSSWGFWGLTPWDYAFNLMQHPGGEDAIQALVDEGANVNAQVYGGDTPLDIAASCACPPAFRTILARGGRGSNQKIRFPDRFLLVPEGIDTAIDFIEAGRRFELEKTQGYESVLCRAVERGSLTAIRRLLKLEDDPNLRDDQGHTPFHYSAELIRHPAGRQGLLALVKEGDLINATNKDGKSALQLAVAKSSCLAVQFLLEQGADPHAGSTFGAASPQFVIEMLEHPDGIPMMLKLFRAGTTTSAFGAASPRFVVERLEHPDGIPVMLELIRAGMTIHDAPRYRVRVRSRARCLKLIREVRKMMVVENDPPLNHAYVAFLSTFYPLLKSHPSDTPLHECEISLIKTEKCNEGGFSDCFEGIFLGCQKVAMKALRAHLKEEVMERRMKREMGVWGRLDHPNVLPFIGWHTLGPTSYMVSPWMENGDALSYVTQNPRANRLQLLVQAADGLHYLHTGITKPVVHGDLKAANIFISSTGVARIADFGLSEYAEEEKPPRYSSEWYYAGNLRWQAPEIVNASSKEEVRRTMGTDNFAYGRVMLELFTGQIPFAYLSDNTLSIFEMVRHGQFPDRPLDKDIIAKGLDDRMWDLMKHCWSMDPKERPSAAEISSHLKAALRGHPDNDSDSEGSASARPAKRARAMEPPMKVEEFDA